VNINRSEFYDLLTLLKLANFRNLGDQYDHDATSLEHRGLIRWDARAHGGGGAWVFTARGEIVVESVVKCFTAGSVSPERSSVV
jgi:hypothetical protein